MQFNEVKIVVQNGDSLEKIIETALEIVKVKTVSIALFTFNEVKVFVHKKSSKETVMDEYREKLSQLYGTR